jgi:hypothetical protein
VQTVNSTWLGILKSCLNGAEEFEAPDSAEWSPRGYAIVQPNASGVCKLKGDIATLGTQPR